MTEKTQKQLLGIVQVGCSVLSHLTQKVASGVLPRGDLNMGTVQPGVGQGWSVKTCRKGRFSFELIHNIHKVSYPSFEHIVAQGLRYIGDGGHDVVCVHSDSEREDVVPVRVEAKYTR